MQNELEELLDQYSIVMNKTNYFYTKYKGRQLRYLESTETIEIGDNDFDRWANSVELEFEVWKPKGMRQFKKWLKSF